MNAPLSRNYSFFKSIAIMKITFNVIVHSAFIRITAHCALAAIKFQHETALKLN